LYIISFVPSKINFSLVSPIRRYDEITKNGPVRADAGQRDVVKKLDDLWYHLREYQPKPYREQGKSRTVCRKNYGEEGEMDNKSTGGGGKGNMKRVLK
jgi:predicted ATPase